MPLAFRAHSPALRLLSHQPFVELLADSTVNNTQATIENQQKWLAFLLSVL